MYLSLPISGCIFQTWIMHHYKLYHIWIFTQKYPKNTICYRTAKIQDKNNIFKQMFSNSTFQFKKLSNKEHKHCYKRNCFLNIDVTLLLGNMGGKNFVSLYSNKILIPVCKTPTFHINMISKTCVTGILVSEHNFLICSLFFI